MRAVLVSYGKVIRPADAGAVHAVRIAEQLAGTRMMEGAHL
jgi:hypothetical protein